MRSPPRISTSGRAPLLSAISRFWISVDSLKRPPTLLTMASSFRSSGMTGPLKMTADDGPQLRHGRLQLVVDYLILILATPFQLAHRALHAALNGLEGCGAPAF